MHKNNIKNKNKKLAQHLVEFALVVPFFVMIFSMIFPYCASAYKNFRYTYILPKQLSVAIDGQPTDGSPYNFTEIMENNMQNRMSPYIIETEQTAYVGGSVVSEYKMLFGIRGNSYYSVIVPINKVFVEKTNLNITNTRLVNDFTAYYNPTESGSGSTEDGGGESTEGGEETTGGDEPTGEGGEETTGGDEPTEGGEGSPSEDETPDDSPNGAPRHKDHPSIKDIIDYFLGGGLW